MRRDGTTTHRWLPEHEQQLVDAMEAIRDLMPHYERQTGSGRAWWDAVAGRLAPAILVTGAACARRWEILEARRHDREVEARLRAEAAAASPPCAKCGEVGAHANTCEEYPPDAWDNLAKRIEEYEATVAERTLETATETAAVVGQLARAVERQTRMMVALCRAWSVAIPAEGEPDDG